nr:Dihydrofolate reductase [uncultured bacterium]AIA15758.1 Dihydrofolate reductase [uncultured bacterium]
MIRAIAAIDDKRGIAQAGNPPWNIPWEIPTDLKHFQQLTKEHIVLMGRHTYELFNQPLPNRQNVVVSRSLDAVRPGFQLEPDAEAFLQQTTDDVWIIGGAALYAAGLQYCDELYLTHVRGDFACDTFFPEYADQFTLCDQSPSQQENGFDFHWAIYKKNR